MPRKNTTKKKLKDFLRKPEKLFLLLAIPLGLLYLSLIPPYQVPDEAAHLQRAYEISELRFVPKRIQDSVGDESPISITQSYAIFEHIPFHYNEKVTPRDYTQAFNLSLDPKRKTFTDFRNTALYSPFPYIASSVAIGVGRLIHLPAIGLLYAARLANLFLWILLLYLAIRITAFAKWSFVIIGVMPMALFEGMSATADVMTNGLAILFSALLFYYAFSPKVKVLNIRHIVFLFLLIFAIATTKLPYALLAGLFFIIPREKLKISSRSYLLLGAGLVLTGFIASLLWPLLMQSRNAVIMPVDTHFQLRTLIFHPGHFIKLVSKFYFISNGSYIYEAIGRLGWLDTDVPLFVLIGYIIMLLAGTSISLPKITKHQFRLAAFFSFAAIIATSAILYINWTPPGSKTLEGIQGRYFIPLFPLLLLALTPLGIRFTRLEKQPVKTTVWFVGISQLASLLAIAIRYYKVL